MSQRIMINPNYSNKYTKDDFEIVKPNKNNYFQRFAQDGDLGFLYDHKIFGAGEPLGSNPNFSGFSTEIPTTKNIKKSYVVPSPSPIESNLELAVNFTAEPEQRAVHVPPFSQTIIQGLGKAVNDEKSVLYQEPFEIPVYKGKLHKNKR